MDWPLLATLSEAHRREFLALGRHRSFARHEVVCHAGDPADSLHMVARGRLSVRVSLPTGDTAMINVLGAGSYFGELALLRRDSYRTATITALEATQTLAVTASAFHKLRESSPAVERTLTALLANRIDELSQQLLEVMYVGLDRRLCRRLVELSRIYATGEGTVVIPLTQSQLADLAGGTRPSVNQSLQKLVDQRIIAVHRGKVEVLDLQRLTGKAGF